jgi:Ca-activated chloride channel family protein
LPKGRARFATEVRAAPLPGSCRRRALGFSIALTALLGADPSPSRAWTGHGQRPDAPRYPVDVRAVALDVLVTDREGRFVSGLKPGDFRVLEQGVGQELSFFTARRTPVTVVVLLDSSASVRSDMLSIQKAANRFIKRLASGDRARIGFFHDQVVFGPRFTDDMREHSAMINQMRPQRSTHLYDAVVESLEKLERVPDRKVLLVFSDGEDQGSRTSMQGALEAARQSDVSVYAVGILGWSAEGGRHTNQGLLEQMARLTGGRAFFPRDEKEMQKAFDRVRAEIHHQYRMGYVPAGGGEGPGEWRGIQVELTRRKDLVVRCRRGYYRDRTQTP